MEAHDHNFNTWERPWRNGSPRQYWKYWVVARTCGSSIQEAEVRGLPSQDKQPCMYVHIHTECESVVCVCVMDDWAAILVLGIELQFSQRATDALNQEEMVTISPPMSCS